MVLALHLHDLLCVTLALLLALVSGVDLEAQSSRNVVSTRSLLIIGQTIYNETLDPFDRTNNIREYLLDPALLQQVDAAYEVRISYLGSPPASYTLSLHRRVVAAQADIGDDDGIAADVSGGRRSAQRVLLDTERIVFGVKDINVLPLEKKFGEIVVEEGVNVDTTISVQYVVRVVTHPWGRRRDGRTSLPPGEGAVYFNIVLEAMVYGVPKRMFPILLAGCVTVLLSLFVFAPAILKYLQPPSPEHFTSTLKSE
jgi:hypothetical protein